MNDTTVVVPWHNGTHDLGWNETCAMVVEQFGLPGNRFRYSPSAEQMIFYFNNAEDAFLCKILLSDRLGK